MDIPKPDVVIYHASCTDGFTAAWAVHRRWPKAITYVAQQYNGPPLPVDVTGKAVLIVDFSYKRPVLDALAAKAASLHVIDHHASAERELAGMPGCIFDMDRSGAGLAWDILHPGRPRPPLVDYAEDHDLWRKKLPLEREIGAAIATRQRTFDDWDDIGLVPEGERDLWIQRMAEEGRGALRHEDAYNRAMLERVQTLTFDGLTVPYVNAPGFGASQLLHEVMKAYKAPMVVGWSVVASGQVIFSLRGDGTYNLEALAVLYGGGGHRNAAGFDMPPNTRPETVVQWLAAYVRELPAPAAAGLPS